MGECLGIEATVSSLDRRNFCQEIE